jgi:hypothetical protein
LRGGFVYCAIALFIPTACGSSEDDPPQTVATGGRSGDGNTGGSGDVSGSGGDTGGSGGRGGTTDPGGAGGEAGETGTNPLAPTVVITSPEAIEDPEDGALVDPEIDVVCEATQSAEDGSEPVNPSTVLLQMLNADGDIVDEKPGTETETDVYTARFVLTSVPNGVVSFGCTASDTSEPPLTASTAISTFVDHGPAIEVISPLPDTAHPLQGSIEFSFTVAPAPLAENDPGAEVSSVTLDVMGVRIDLEESPEGQFRGNVTLSDMTMFPERATEVPVLIQATNSREPDAATSDARYTIIIDEQGPVIVITSPGEEDVVGKSVEVHFTATDDLTEVDEATVSVAVNRGAPTFFDPDPLGPWSKNGDAFVYVLDTTTISGSVAQLTLNVNASDAAGNRARGESIVLFLDNQPPIVDLDPPYFRGYQDLPDDQDDLCSQAFDPVGNLSANDGQGVLAAHRFRAIVWAMTNQAPGQRIVYHSPTDETSVFLYLLDNPGPDNPLLTDTDGDGVCDEVIDRQSLTDLHLSPLPPTGSLWFGGPLNEPQGAPPAPALCEAYQGDPEPRHLCDNRSDMWVSISHSMDGKPPVIYALGSSLGGTGSACAGADWEIGSSAQEGWVCVAGRAEDEVHNVGVSRPLRLCYDNGVDPPPDCPMPPPSCLDGCLPPPPMNEVLVVP